MNNTHIKIKIINSCADIYWHKINVGVVSFFDIKVSVSVGCDGCVLGDTASAGDGENCEKFSVSAALTDTFILQIGGITLEKSQKKGLIRSH